MLTMQDNEQERQHTETQKELKAMQIDRKEFFDGD